MGSCIFSVEGAGSFCFCFKMQQLGELLGNLFGSGIFSHFFLPFFILHFLALFWLLCIAFLRGQVAFSYPPSLMVVNDQSSISEGTSSKHPRLAIGPPPSCPALARGRRRSTLRWRCQCRVRPASRRPTPKWRSRRPGTPFDCAGME